MTAYRVVHAAAVMAAAEEKAFKKLFLQRPVLDVLRMYLDPKQEFLDQMKDYGHLSEDEVFVLQVKFITLTVTFRRFGKNDTTSTSTCIYVIKSKPRELHTCT